MPDFDDPNAQAPNLPSEQSEMADREQREAAWDQAAVLLVHSRSLNASPRLNVGPETFQAEMSDLLDELAHDRPVRAQDKALALSFEWMSGVEVPSELARAAGAFREPALLESDVLDEPILPAQRKDSNDAGSIGGQHGQ
jgi:hypothetical protein